MTTQAWKRAPKIKRIEGQMFAAIVGPIRKQPQTALRARGRGFETVQLDDAGNVIESPPRCCNGVVLHAPNCKTWGIT